MSVDKLRVRAWQAVWGLSGALTPLSEYRGLEGKERNGNLTSQTGFHFILIALWKLPLFDGWGREKPESEHRVPITCVTVTLAAKDNSCPAPRGSVWGLAISEMQEMSSRALCGCHGCLLMGALHCCKPVLLCACESEEVSLSHARKITRLHSGCKNDTVSWLHLC